MVSLTILTELLIPAAMQRVASAAVTQWLGETEELSVEFGGRPGYQSMLGHFRQVRVTVHGLTVLAVPVERLEVELRDLRVDLNTLWQERRLAFRHSYPVIFRFQISEAALADYMTRHSPLQEAEARLTPAGATIQGFMQWEELIVNVSLRGDFVLATEGGRDLRFRLDAIDVNGYEVPSSLVEQLEPVWEQATGNWLRLPQSIELTEVELQEGRLILAGEQR